jgi:hypothetical protein
MDKSQGDLGFGDVKNKRKKERQGKSLDNYLSHQAKIRKATLKEGDHERNGRFNGMENPFNPNRNKCKEFCCIVFCCVDANIYYGEREYGQLIAKAEADRLKLIDEGGDPEKGPAGGTQIKTIVSYAT